MQTQQQRRTGREVQVQAQRALVERTREFQAELDQYAPQILQALPKHVSIDKFKRVLVTAAAMNSDLLYANRGTLYLAALKCASDGLLPDGREAALVVFNTEVKRRDPETGLDQKFRIDAVQYMPMIQGIRERMRRTGEITSAEAHVVRAKDHFKYRLGDDPLIDHVPPALTEDRGDVVGAYAIIKLKSGEVLRDVMNKHEIEAARSVSRAKDSPMWTKFYGEAARKTVLRRCAKAAPQTSEMERHMERLFERQDEAVELPPTEITDGMHQVEPEPERTEFPPLRNDFYHDEDGVIHEEAAAEPSGGAGVGGSAAGATVAPEPEQAPPAPAERPFPGDQPSESRGLPVPQLHGKPDYRKWTFGLFLPKVRQAMSSADLAVLCGDNEAELAAAKRHLPRGDLRELEALITQRWDEIAEIEKEAVA